MRRETYYQATMNSAGVQPVILRIDEQNRIIGTGDNDNSYLTPRVPLDEINAEWSFWTNNMYPTYQQALDKYLEVERWRLANAKASITAALKAAKQSSPRQPEQHEKSEA